jgi:hypothetical protein
MEYFDFYFDSAHICLITRNLQLRKIRNNVLLDFLYAKPEANTSRKT